VVCHRSVLFGAAVALTTCMPASAKKSLARAKAHYDAMMALINTEPAHIAHPAIWAPYVVVGKGGR